MRVMIHGAINCTNYGDFLFAALFTDALKKKGIEIEYYSHPKYGISDFFARNLGYTPDRKHYKEVMKRCDALVYISGGYFLSHKKIREEFSHTRRYLPPGVYFMKSGKPIYILGVGAGPFYKGRFSKIAKDILQYASVLTVRNDESKDYCNNLGIDRDISVTADTALVIYDFMYNNKADIAKFNILSEKRMLLFHIDWNHAVKRKLKTVAIPAIKRFLNNHKEYELFLASDGVMPDSLFDEYAHMFDPYSPHILKYDDPWALTRQIERADLIFTTKLHIGIIGAAFGRSVVSFPWHQKTQRFYKQIGEEERCVLLSEANEETVFSQLERFEGKGIVLPEELIEKAKENLEMLPKTI